MYGRRKFSSAQMVTSDYPSVSGWKAVLNHRSVPRSENISSQNLLTNRRSRSEMITSGIPCRDVPLAKNPSTGTAQQRLF